MICEFQKKSTMLYGGHVSTIITNDSGTFEVTFNREIKHPSFCYTKTDLVFGFSKNQILVAVILGQNCFWIIAENHFEMSIMLNLL